MLIQIKDREVEVVIRRSKRSRRLRLAVHRGGGATLTVPFLMSEERLTSFAQRFILEKGDWLLKAIDKLKKYAPAGPKKTAAETKREYQVNKTTAKKFVTERLLYFNQFYGFKIGNISIRNQKSRWGSCSRKGNLNFNYRIALIPSELADYIVVHELSHIGQLNHSKKFWDLVALTIPDHKERRKKLKGNFNSM